MSDPKSGSARDIFDTQPVLAFAQMLLVKPEGLRIAAGHVDDMKFRTVCSTVGVGGIRRLVRDRAGERICDQLEWTVGGHFFSVRSEWRAPRIRDLAVLEMQDEQEGR